MIVTPQRPSTPRVRAQSLPHICVVSLDNCATTQPEETTGKLGPHASPAQRAVSAWKREPAVASGGGTTNEPKPKPEPELKT